MHPRIEIAPLLLVVGVCALVWVCGVFSLGFLQVERLGLFQVQTRSYGKTRQIWFFWQALESQIETGCNSVDSYFIVAVYMFSLHLN